MVIKRAVLPNRLPILRAERAVSQEALAAAIGVGHDRLFRIETGKSEASDEERINLAKVLGVTQADIWPNRPIESRRTA